MSQVASCTGPLIVAVQPSGHVTLSRPGLTSRDDVFTTEQCRQLASAMLAAVLVVEGEDDG